MMRNVFLTGTLEKHYMKSTSKETILNQANSSSLGVFVDDLEDITGISDGFVDSVYNGASKATISRGRETINLGLVLTSNSAVSATAR